MKIIESDSWLGRTVSLRVKAGSWRKKSFHLDLDLSGIKQGSDPFVVGNPPKIGYFEKIKNKEEICARADVAGQCKKYIYVQRDYLQPENFFGCVKKIESAWQENESQWNGSIGLVSKHPLPLIICQFVYPSKESIEREPQELDIEHKYALMVSAIFPLPGSKTDKKKIFNQISYLQVSSMLLEKHVDKYWNIWWAEAGDRKTLKLLTYDRIENGRAELRKSYDLPYLIEADVLEILGEKNLSKVKRFKKMPARAKEEFAQMTLQKKKRF